MHINQITTPTRGTFCIFLSLISNLFSTNIEFAFDHQYIYVENLAEADYKYVYKYLFCRIFDFKLILKSGDDEIIAVSPDGTLRNSKRNSIFQENVLFAVECKCPKPNYKYNTPVYYKVPERYICQVTLELK